MAKGKTFDVYKGDRRNIAGLKIKRARMIHDPTLTQVDLAEKIQRMGYTDMTELIVSRIERGIRPITDAELKIFAAALGQSLDWLTQDFEPAVEVSRFD